MIFQFFFAFLFDISLKHALEHPHTAHPRNPYSAKSTPREIILMLRWSLFCPNLGCVHLTLCKVNFYLNYA